MTYFLNLILVLIAAASLTTQVTAQVNLTEAALRGPAVASILELERDTPAKLLRSVFTLFDLGEADVAQTLWNDFDGGAIDEAAKVALVKQFGAARFLELMQRESADGLNGARAFAESCLQASAEQNRNPERLAKLISDLNSASGETQQAARSDLAVTGDMGAIACLEALAKASSNQDENKILRTQLLLTLAKMRPSVEPMLVASLAGGRGQFRRDVAELTGYLHLQDAVPWLAVLATSADADPQAISAAYAALAKMGLSAPTSADAKAVVLSEIRCLESHLHDADVVGPWWSYETDEQTLSAREVSAKQQKLLAIARLANALTTLPDATSGDRQLALIYAYQVSQLLDQPLPSHLQQLADALGTAALGQMLHDAMQTNQLSAATACAQLLGKRSDSDALASVAGRRSPLAAALEHSNHELRFAALEAVMALKPQQSFAGASGVPKALWQFAVSAGTPQVVVASSTVTNATEWAGQLRGLGYDATPVATGRQAMRLAIESKRLEFILVDSDIGRPLVREVIYQLRSASQTARTPIAVLCSLHNLPRVERLAERDDWLLATPRPHGKGTIQDVVSRLAELDSGRLSAELRNEQATAALGWIADLLETGHPYDELLREANLVSETLYEPSLTVTTLRVMAVLGTAKSQQLLLDYVSTSALPLESRREAGVAFAKSVERFGKLLTAEEIVRQYDRYNASETEDRATQEILGAVLDVLEKK